MRARLLSCREVPLQRRLAYGILAREGLRKEELRALRWLDLDLARGAVTLGSHKTEEHTGARTWRLRADVLEVLRWLASQRPSITGEVLPGLVVSNLPRQLRQDLALAGVTRAELFEGNGSRRRLRAHDLRATFVTLALASGASEQWVSDRTGHTSSEMLQRYRRAARTAAELELGPLGLLDRLLPECVDSLCREPVYNPSSVEEATVQNLSGEGGIRALGTLAGTHDFQSAAEEGAPECPGESVPRLAGIREYRQAVDTLRGKLSPGEMRVELLAALELADSYARALELPAVRIRIANARKAVGS